MGLTEVDLDALHRAIAWGRRYQLREPGIAVLPQPFPPENTHVWIEAASRLAAMAQSVTLGLAPWQCEPAITHDDGIIDDDCYGRRSNEVGFRRKMIALGISIFEPDPPRALADCEREPAA